MQAVIEANFSLTKWTFRAQNAWTADASFEKVPAENLEKVLGMTYPLKGSLTGQFHGRGSRAEPNVTGLFDLADGSVYGVSFNRLRGQLNLASGEARIANAELRFFAPGKEGGRGTGIDRKSTRLNSSHGYISYAVFCLKKKKQLTNTAEFRFRPYPRRRGGTPVHDHAVHRPVRVRDDARLCGEYPSAAEPRPPATPIHA